jgi:UDP-N-acetylmuramate dehydrogenase
MTLPTVRGALTPNRPMADISWLRTGGAAEWLFQPADLADLEHFLVNTDPRTNILPVGVCSNIIIRDGGIRGIVIRLGRGFSGIEVLEGNRIRAGAAALDAHVARKAREAGIDLAFLRTIPGTIGGAVKMNAGCYGVYAADICESIDIVTRSGRFETLPGKEAGFAYRSSNLPEGAIVVGATLKGPPGDPAKIAEKMELALEKRAATQPVKDRSCGSTFRNPAGFSSTGKADDVHDLKAWKLIEDAGMKGAILGGAQMSPMHANFLINTGTATSADLENLGELVRKKVYETSGITLEWEILREGDPA